MLQETIERAYRVFKHYPAIRPLDVCTAGCCMDLADEERLAIMPVREIPLALLMEYNDGAKSSKTPIEEVKHFLPRYFELISNFQFPSHSTELSFCRLVPFSSQEWKADELELLHSFAVAFFRKCLHTYPIDLLEKIDAILIMFWNAGFDIDPLLNEWEKDHHFEAVLHFKDLCFEGFNGQYHRTKLSNAFGDKALADKLATWLASDPVTTHFAAKIEQIILAEHQIAADALNDLNLLYETLRSGSSSYT